MGGMNPALSGAVSDSNSCSGTVLSMTAGSLGAIAGSSLPGLENPKRMRTSADTVNFPQGRGLILENIDGFSGAPNVFRKSPHLLNLNQRFGSFGLSGNVFDLQTFATGAVTQHFPRTLARNNGGTAPDFRLPTSAELAAMEAFMRAQDFPAGNDPNKFNLNNFLVTAAQQRGFNAFFGAAKCSFCHSGQVLSDFVPFNTGVVNQTINSAAVDNLPCEPASPCGSRTFITRQLFNIANLGPFFHDGSAATLKDVLAFYNSSNFANSPGSQGFSGPISTTALETDDIIAFLEGISFSPFAPIFGPVGTGVTITGTTFTGATAVSFNGVTATFTEGPPGTITTTVPAGATTGPITVTTPSGGPLVTTTRFTVTPAMSSFAPANGPVGTSVTITGTSFTGATSVSFGGKTATFTVNNSTTVTTTVPFGANTGLITVTTLDGTATSATNFTVTPGGPPFGVGSTPSSQTVSAGASTNYNLTISRSTGFTDNLTFTATGLPAATTATFSPNPTTGNSSTMTVTTTARPAQLAPWTTLRLPPANFSVRAWPLWAICLLVMVLLAYQHRVRRNIPRWVFATGAFIVLLCIGCGGGSTPKPPPPPPGTPAGTFTITVTATSSNTSVQPVTMPVTLIVK
jgi:hypothetical protein